MIIAAFPEVAHCMFKNNNNLKSMLSRCWIFIYGHLLNKVNKVVAGLLEMIYLLNAPLCSPVSCLVLSR